MEFRLPSQRACIVVSSVWPSIDKQVEQIVKECIPCQPAIHQSPDYTVCCKDRNGFGGGVVMYIRDNTLYSQRNDLAIDDLELACIEVKLPYNKSFLVATWYRPPSSQIDLFHEWALFLSKCDTENKELIIVGDFNCNVSKALPDSQRLKFLCFLDQLKQSINEPTRVKSTSATLIN